MMKNIYLLPLIFILISCYSSEQHFNQSNNTNNFSSFQEICTTNNPSEINIKNPSQNVWEFSPLDLDKKRKCMASHLSAYKGLNCQYEKDLIGNIGIHLYKGKEGWYRFAYQSQQDCQNSLELYNAQSEEL